MATKLFEKGNPGGPGRPKGSGRNQLCQEILKKHGWARIFDIALGRPFTQKIVTSTGVFVKTMPASEDIQLTALKFIADHGEGKPATKIEHSGTDGQPLTINLVKYEEPT